MVLPGSLTYRTYGYLMVAYAVEKQWGAAIELALVRDRNAEKMSKTGCACFRMVCIPHLLLLLLYFAGTYYIHTQRKAPLRHTCALTHGHTRRPNMPHEASFEIIQTYAVNPSTRAPPASYPAGYRQMAGENLRGPRGSIPPPRAQRDHVRGGPQVALDPRRRRSKERGR